ncbi:NADPH-dependent F420 reductase [Nocardioides sp. LHG3406-4]|uniref:NADPH-dependent F420 reductase n=1 Tax=Nocardioides sp. LHG3406-4 TaxID=2804575 RepID=UPI003CEB41F1
MTTNAARPDATIAVLGGTGPQGSGLALRLARAGYQVVLGSRTAERAEVKAGELRAAGLTGVTGTTNPDACEAADVVVVAVPYDGHDELIATLAPHLTGKIVITCVNPMRFDKRGPVGLLAGNSSAAEAAAELLPHATVVGAFHHLSAVSLNDPDADLSGHTVMVASDDEDAADQVAELARAVTGNLGVCIGPLRLNRHLEPLTAVLISTNRRYRTHSGVALVGVPDGPPLRR